MRGRTSLSTQKACFPQIRLQFGLAMSNALCFHEAEPKTQKSRRTIVIASFALKALKEQRIRQTEEKKNDAIGKNQEDGQESTFA
ncbi:MAG: hypothetical protein JO202_13165 [Ktedonobacteraceae bacterium]|nr:hypothetical protein [Ktedonobacteraceae bacterium]